MANSYRRRKPKTGSTAIPFLITILISMIVLGSIAYYFYGKIKNKNVVLQPMKSAVTSISENDINEILFVLKPTAENRRPAVMLLRFDPIRKQEYCVGIPLSLTMKYDGREETVEQCLENRGISNLKDALGATLDQKIDRYLQMDSAGFYQLVGLIGNVNYLVSIQDVGLHQSDTSQLLDSSQYETLLTSKNYYSEEERASVIGLSVAALLNQCDGQRIANNLDGYFSAIINKVTTNITNMDYSNHCHAIKFVFGNAQAPARGMSVVCDPPVNGKQYVNEYFIESMKRSFSQITTEQE
jgi:anionic cell wall polymer biosynthesis LytR-Cps2A-Psr (LCP) family protein